MKFSFVKNEENEIFLLQKGTMRSASRWSGTWERGRKQIF